MIDTEHLDADLVAAYLDGDLPDGERESVQAHLSECDECCDELTAIDDTLRSTRGGRSLRRYAVPAVAAAAVLVAVFVARPWLEEPSTQGLEPGVIERTSPDIVSTRIESLSPVQGAVVDLEDLRLQWRSAGEGARYQITVTTTQGDSVWVSVVPDTVAPVPIGLVEPDREYLWYVDALLPNGGTASTGISHFRTKR
jgi:hypothetical protein